ncbi:MAG: aminomethyl-transferring glycine dehydrogenase subunit GcvPA, partial [Halobacteriota archaeon]
MTMDRSGSPYAPHTAEETATMLEAVGVDDEAALFDIPDGVAFEGAFDIEARSERELRGELTQLLETNDDLTEFLGRGHYAHYVPSVVDHLSLRSEFLTSYTQYQPEITQGFLQALFEYQSMLVELTGLPVANCSMYDAATALGEAARLAARLRQTTGSTVLVPGQVRAGKRGVLDNYVEGTDLTVESYPLDDGNVDVEALADLVSDETAMVYVENPTVRGTIEERLADVGSLAADNDALFCLGSDIVALALLQEPAAVG